MRFPLFSAALGVVKSAADSNVVTRRVLPLGPCLDLMPRAAGDRRGTVHSLKSAT